MYDIEEQLQDYGFSLNNYSGFTLPSTDPRGTYSGLLIEDQMLEPLIVREHLVLNALASLEPEQQFTFNQDQQLVFGYVISMVEIQHTIEPKVVFLDGPGGTGKTYLFNALLDATRRNHGICDVFEIEKYIKCEEGTDRNTVRLFTMNLFDQR